MLTTILGCSASETRPLPRLAEVTASLRVGQGSSCAVAVSKINYDNPGTDDAEFIELVVSGDFRGRTLSDCGLGSMLAVNGGAEACDTSAPPVELGAIPVPDDGIVLICASESAHDVVQGCDVTPASRSGGWIQNGPRDGFLFSSPDDTEHIGVSFEGVNDTCFADEPMALRTEDGSIGNDVGGEEDDVNVWCHGAFQLVAISAALPRSANPCPPIGDAGASGADAGVGGAGGTGASGGSADAGGADGGTGGSGGRGAIGAAGQAAGHCAGEPAVGSAGGSPEAPRPRRPHDVAADGGADGGTGGEATEAQPGAAGAGMDPISADDAGAGGRGFVVTESSPTAPRDAEAQRTPGDLNGAVSDASAARGAAPAAIGCSVGAPGGSQPWSLAWLAVGVALVSGRRRR